MSRIYKHIYALLVACFCCFSSLTAQTVKQIEVEEGVPYVDHVALIEGSKDMDLLVKFTFNEPENSLTVSLISYKKLFVFQDKVRYKKSQSWRKLIPAKLPYVVQSDEMVYYKYMKPLRKSISPKRKHVFNRWIEVDGLQPQPTEYKMVNEYIEQKFDIVSKRSKVQVNLRDVLVMNEHRKGVKMRYDLFFQTNINRNYEISILRNPCFGKEEMIEAAKVRRENAEKSYLSLCEKFGPKAGPAVMEKEPLFHEMKSLLAEQYPTITEKSECPEIQQAIKEYNAIVDSIAAMEYSYEKDRVKPIPLDLEPEYILMMARKIDNAVNRYQLTPDEVEKKDLATACDKIVKMVMEHLDRTSTMTDPQAEAVSVFLHAKTYFQKNCQSEDKVEE